MIAHRRIRPRFSRRSCAPRTGAAVVEVAIVAPVAFLLLIGIMVGSLGAFRYQQLAFLAREGSRYASIHGEKYAKRTGGTAATGEEVLNNAVLPIATGFDPEKLQCQLVRDPVRNTVSVTLTYVWTGEIFLPTITLTNTSLVVALQ